MVARVPERVLLPMSQLRKEKVKWFTIQEWAQDTGCSVRTLNRWLAAMHAGGDGPKPDQVWVKRINAARRIKRWRGDYLLLVERRFCTMK